jgi:predicted RNA-binding Zn-ribbon protein involved in translation (DUF1610 family)
MTPEDEDVDSPEEDRENGDEHVPYAVAPRCGEDAATWVNTTDGTRTYLCPEHAVEVFRFEDLLEEDSPEDVDVDVDIDVEEHPSVRMCPGCGKPTLLSDINSLGQGGMCPACDNGTEEADVKEWAEAFVDVDAPEQEQEAEGV